MEGDKACFNGSDDSAEVQIPKGDWTVVASDGTIDHEGLKDDTGMPVTSKGGKVVVPHRSALILARG